MICKFQTKTLSMGVNSPLPSDATYIYDPLHPLVPTNKTHIIFSNKSS